MAQHGKKYREALAQVDRETLYGVSEAIDIVKRLSRPLRAQRQDHAVLMTELHRDRNRIPRTKSRT